MHTLRDKRRAIRSSKSNIGQKMLRFQKVIPGSLKIIKLFFTLAT